MVTFELEPGGEGTEARVVEIELKSILGREWSMYQP